MKARRLCVLDINDRDVPSFQTGEGIAKHFEIRRLRTWKAVQQDVCGGRPFKPDIVLADIDFEDDPSIRDVTFSDCGEAKPIGPLLALPYVTGRAVSTFAVYSAHLKKETSSGVMRSPWILLPFGILFAKLEGRVFGSSIMNQTEKPGAGSLEDEIARLRRIGNPGDALEEALSRHILRLLDEVEAGRVRVTNGERLCRTLSLLAEECKAAGNEALLSVDENLYAELYSEGYGVDRIQWLSLCADIVGFQDDRVNAAGADEMVNLARDLCGSDPAFQMAVEVIKVQDEKEEESHQRPAFDKVAADLYQSQDEGTRREILRVGVLLANAHAWALGNFTAVVKKRLFERLGTSSEGNTYSGWFGARSGAKKVCQRSLNVDRLEVFMNKARGTVSYHIEWGETELQPEDKMRIRHYLEAFQRVEGYNLPAGLSYLSTE